MSRPETPTVGWGGDPRRGAALGRPSSPPDARAYRLSVRRVRLYGDYDKGGTYWGGGGAPLFYFEGEDPEGETVDGYLRAADHDHAVSLVAARYPSARFMRGATR